MNLTVQRSNLSLHRLLQSLQQFTLDLRRTAFQMGFGPCSGSVQCPIGNGVSLEASRFASIVSNPRERPVFNKGTVKIDIPQIGGGQHHRPARVHLHFSDLLRKYRLTIKNLEALLWRAVEGYPIKGPCVVSRGIRDFPFPLCWIDSGNGGIRLDVQLLGEMLGQIIHARHCNISRGPILIFASAVRVEFDNSAHPRLHKPLLHPASHVSRKATVSRGEILCAMVESQAIFSAGCQTTADTP